MRILGAIVVFICTVCFAILGGLLLALSFNLVTTQELIGLVGQTFQVQDIHFIVGGIGFLLILASIFIAQITMGRMQREKTIAFNNPEGQVTVSLSAIEEFIKRLSLSLTEIKELRSNVVAGKKGIEINTRVSLWANVNIPQATEGIQSIIKNRIQEMLGIEEPIVVRVHVGKIVSKEKKRPERKGKEKGAEEGLPFRGNIEYGKG